MAERAQTAIRGVASASVFNLVARLLAFGFHVAVTAFIGLSGGLDAYFVALSVVTLTFFVFGDGFNSVGVPSLVDALRREGDERFGEIAGALIVLAVGASACLAIVVAATTPWAHLIAPGLRAETVPLVAANLVRLAPLAVSYLPCRAAASVLRAQRRFAAAAGWEVVAAATTLGTVVALRRAPFGVALSASAGALAGAIVLAAMVRSRVRFSARLMPDGRLLLGGLVALLPIWGVVQLFQVADRFFASYLTEGAISAITFGQLLALAPGAVLTLDAVFMTPLSEAEDRAPMLRKIVDGILILAIPAAFFAFAFAGPAVSVAFERGRFDGTATRMTAAALRGFAVGLPALLAWPVLYRVFQILGRTDTAFRLAVGAFLLNCALNAGSLAFGFGILGVALATSVSTYCLALGALFALRGALGALVGRETAAVAAQAAIASGLALLAANAIPPSTSTSLDLLAKGSMFAVVAVAFLGLTPSRGVRTVRATVIADLTGRDSAN